MTTVRESRPSDRVAILRMARAFAASTEYVDRAALSETAVSALVDRLEAEDDGVVLVSTAQDRVTGMLALWIFAHPFTGTRTASELAWWVDPACRGAGVRLLRSAHIWATDRGARVMQMIAPTERVGRLYRRMGYRQADTTYEMRL